jgi:hypothetical protein
VSAGHIHIRPNLQGRVELTNVLREYKHMLFNIMIFHFYLGTAASIRRQKLDQIDDRDLPSKIKIGEQDIDVRPFLTAHELLEKVLIEVAGCDYERARICDIART